MRTEDEGADRIVSDEVFIQRASPENIAALASDLVPEIILNYVRGKLHGVDGSTEQRVELARAATRLDNLPAEMLTDRRVMVQANSIPDRTRADLQRHVSELCFRDRSLGEQERLHLQSQLQETLRPLNVQLDKHVSELFSFAKQSPQFYDLVLADDLHAAVDCAFGEQNQIRRDKMIRCAVCHHQIHMIFWLQVAFAFFTAFNKPRLPPFLRSVVRMVGLKAGQLIKIIRTLSRISKERLQGFYDHQSDGLSADKQGKKGKAENYIRKLVKPIFRRMKKSQKLAYKRAIVDSCLNLIAGIDGVINVIESEIAVRERQIATSRAVAGLEPCDDRQLQLFTSYTHGMPRDAFFKVFILRYLQASDAAYRILNRDGPIRRIDLASLLDRKIPKGRKVFASSERAHLVMVEHINIASGSERDSVGNTESYKLAVGLLDRFARSPASGSNATVTDQQENLFEALDPLNLKLV